MTLPHIAKSQSTTHCVHIGPLALGGNHPIAIQSMTNTDTADVDATVSQIIELAEAGSELVRVTINTEAAAQAMTTIRATLNAQQIQIPIIGDFHFNGHRLLQKHPECGQALDKLRINPGNVGRGKKKDEQFEMIIKLARDFKKPVRIGVNWGSLDQSVLARLMDANAQRSTPLEPKRVMREAMLVSALESAEQAMQWGLPENAIVLSVKVSDVQDLIAVYRALALRCSFPLHLGLTEAGMGAKGIVASTAALAVLLNEGIGDTIRISLTPEPNSSRTQEVRVARHILQSLGLRTFTPTVIACPGCGRTTSDYFQHLAQDIQAWLEQQIPQWHTQFPGVQHLKVAVMGCVVNGPGESKIADIGISLPGSGELPVAPVYEDGQKTVTLKGDHIAEEFKDRVIAYITRRWGKH